MDRNILDDSLNFALGIFTSSKEKIEGLVDKMIERGEVEKERRESLVDEYIKKGEEEKANINARIDERIENFINKHLSEEKIREIVNEELDKRNL